MITRLLIKNGLSAMTNLACLLAAQAAFAQDAIAPTDDLNGSVVSENTEVQNEDQDTATCLTREAYETIQANVNQAFFGHLDVEGADKIIQDVLANIDCVEDQRQRAIFYLEKGMIDDRLGRPDSATQYLSSAVSVCRRNRIDCLNVTYLPDNVSQNVEKIMNDVAFCPDPGTNQYIQIDNENHPFGLNFVPFGAPQFGQHDKRAGAIYASIQASGLLLTIIGASITGFYMNECKSSNACGNGNVLPKDEHAAKSAQATMYSGIALLGAGYLASVIHGLINYTAKTQIISYPKEADILSQTNVVSPIMLEQGAGIAYSTRF